MAVHGDHISRLFCMLEVTTTMSSLWLGTMSVVMLLVVTRLLCGRFVGRQTQFTVCCCVTHCRLFGQQIPSRSYGGLTRLFVQVV